MKKVIFYLIVVVSSFILLSNEGGRGAASGPATGAPGEMNGTCGNQGCHSAGEFRPELSVSLLDEMGNSVDGFIPGDNYKVAVKINHTGLPAGYGFQIVCLDETAAPVNNFQNLPSGLSELFFDDRQYVEQNQRIPIDSITIDWVAPAGDSITFYLAANAVNGNGSPQGDGATNGAFVFNQAPTILAFVDAPSDVTINCSDMIPAPIDLNYTPDSSTNCGNGGMVSPVIIGSFNICGGMISYVWEATDDCGNAISHTQSIVMEPTSIVQFLNPPADVNIPCNETPLHPPVTLSYSNNETGSCEVSGNVAAVVNGIFDICGATLSYEWIFTDPCGNTVSHIQTIDIEPAPVAQFLNLPADIEIPCDESQLPPLTELLYSNNETGDCEISGSVLPNEVGIFECENEIVYTWELLNECTGNFISHSRTIRIGTTSSTNHIEQNENLLIYPNPADNVIHIETDTGIKEVKLRDISGQILTQTTRSLMDVSKLPSGLYLLEVTTIEGDMFLKKCYKN